MRRDATREIRTRDEKPRAFLNASTGLEARQTAAGEHDYMLRTKGHKWQSLGGALFPGTR